MNRIGIIGGGPGGLMTAYLLDRKYENLFETALFEADSTLGGKLQTRSFTRVPVPYEAGAAEIYDYGAGEDPLRDLVDELELTRQPMTAGPVILEGAVLREESDILAQWGEPCLEAMRSFRRRASSLLPLDRWVSECWTDAAADLWAGRTTEELLAEVKHPTARKYLRITAHADLATEPHLTSGLNGLKNFVMDIPGYVSCRSIQGGMGRLAMRLEQRLGATQVELGARVKRIECTPTGGYEVHYVEDGRRRRQDFDTLIVALPLDQLAALEYDGETLHRAMGAHLVRYDRPGHYLRVSLLFDEPFWRRRLTGSWFTIDAFGGTCVYDESSRLDTGRYGVLGFLLAGSHALSMANAEDQDIVQRVLESLPDSLRHEAGERLLETRVHRWCGAISGQPGGIVACDPDVGLQPDPVAHPGLFVVGDYLFDSTLNGVCRSADLVASRLSSRLFLSRSHGGVARDRLNGAVGAMA